MAIDRRRMQGNYLPLRDAIDRLFEGSFISPQMLGGGQGGQMQTGFPAANVRVTDDDVIIEMAVPGVNPDEISVAISGDTVTISGDAVREKHDQKGRTYVEEIWEGAFSRSFVLPFPVDAEKANATFENGILRLSLPKSEAAKPRKVKVRHHRTIQGQKQEQQDQQAQAQQQSRAQQEQNQQQAGSDVQKETVRAGSGQRS